MKTTTKLGKELKKIRIDYDLSMVDFAKIMNASEKHLSAIEHGDKPVPNDFIDKLSCNFKNTDIKKMKILALMQSPIIHFGLNLINEHEKDIVSELFKAIFIDKSELNIHQYQDIIKILKWTPTDKMMRWIKSPEAEKSMQEYIDEEEVKSSRELHQMNRIKKFFSNTEDLKYLIEQCVRDNHFKLVWRIFQIGFGEGVEYEPKEEQTFATYTKKYMNLYFERVDGQGSIHSILNENFNVLWSD